ncbi:DUF3488 and transglutaminase-like domain-containing protein [Spirillospora sp. NPDC047279]|uniref:DUF3488 and transglutaminase-like domain-containing protein n=1 Tax=Spirillospora sp. NPDC047279 TaxID=3155478 RepID=UPI0033C3D345
MRRYLSLVVTASLAAVAGLAFHRVFGFGPVVPVVAVAATVPTVLSAALAGPRSDRPWPLWVSLVLTVIGWTATVAVTVLRPALSGGTLPQALREGVLSSWKSILTTLLPAPAKPEFLVLVHVLVWLAAFASAELSLRTSLRAAPCLPAFAVFGVALMLGVDGPGSNLPLVAATVVLIVVLVLIRGRMGVQAGAQAGAGAGAETGSGAGSEAGTGTGAGAGARADWRPVLLGLPVAAALGGLAFVTGPHLPVNAEPYNPRENVAAPPPQQRDSVSPLDRVGGWLHSGNQILFSARGGKPEPFRLVVLDRFDGVTWSSAARFTPTGSRVPADPEPGERLPLSQTITIRELPGVWLPAADRPRLVKGLGVVVDPESGTMASAQQLKAGQAYQVDAQVRTWKDADFGGAGVAQDAQAKAATELPWGPGATAAPVQIAEFRAFAQRATAGATSPGQQAAMLADHLKKYARYDVSAPPGHSYRQLDYFLGESRRGTPEQFATAYALLGRTLGLPTRVKVGFTGGTLVGDERVIRSGDVMVWPEVKLDGYGWVEFDPIPVQAKRSKDSTVATGETKQGLENAQRNAVNQNRGNNPGKSAPPVPPKAGADGGLGIPVWTMPVAGVVLLVLGYLLAVLIAPVLRRRRRRSGSPAERIAGAWHQTLEHLHDVGLATARTLTAHEVARFGARNLGDAALAHLRPLADLVNRSRFSAGAADPRAADAAWEHSDQVGRLVTAKAGLPRRLLRRLHPRSLRPR